MEGFDLEGVFGDCAGDYLGDVDAALAGLDGVGDAGATGMDVMDLVRNPAKLRSAIRGAQAAHASSMNHVRKHKVSKNLKAHRVSSQMAMQHAANIASLTSLAAMHAQQKAQRHMRANYAFGLTLGANGGGSYATPAVTDIASITSPVGDQPWHIVSWQTDLNLAQYFVILQFIPATVDVVNYGSAGVSYAAVAPTKSLPLYNWCVQNYGAPSTPAWQLAPWQAPGYGFGPAAVVKLQLGLIDNAGKSINLLVLGRCSPCKRRKFAQSDDGFHRLSSNFYSGNHPGAWH